MALFRFVLIYLVFIGVMRPQDEMNPCCKLNAALFLTVVCIFAHLPTLD